MNEPARIIAKGAAASRVLWDADDQVAARLREVIQMTDIIQLRIEHGDLPGATRAALAAKRLAKEGLELRGKVKGGRR